MKRCIYPGSFDPITFGHLDIIERASKIFEDVIVTIGINPSKSTLFNVLERTEMIKLCVAHLPNVRVTEFSGLLADYAYEMDCNVVVKGVRNFQDFDYERLLHDIGLTQQRGIDTFTLHSRQDFNHISSSSVKELVKNFGLVDEYVPLSVKYKLEEKLCHYYVYGITGEIGMGKSYITDILLRQPVMVCTTHIDLDKIGHDILNVLNEPVYVTLRETLIKEFKLKHLVDNKDNGPSDTVSWIDRRELGEIVFKDNDALKKLNSLMRIPILTRLRRTLLKKAYPQHHVVIINGALLVEADFLNVCNNKIMVVKSPKANQFENLKARGLSYEQIHRRMQSQYTTDKKVEKIKDAIRKHNFGSVKVLENYNPELNFQIETLAKNMRCGY